MKGNMDTIQLKRIADAISEILELVKKDLERQKQYLEKEKS
jgi:hypothetical protein|tara:strand:- start:366 stop:488 length:123 start_codon:yes stop_codon:yes gene_type:complete